MDICFLFARNLFCTSRNRVFAFTAIFSPSSICTNDIIMEKMKSWQESLCSALCHDGKNLHCEKRLLVTEQISFLYGRSHTVERTTCLFQFFAQCEPVKFILEHWIPWWDLTAWDPCAMLSWHACPTFIPLIEWVSLSFFLTCKRLCSFLVWFLSSVCPHVLLLVHNFTKTRVMAPSWVVRFPSLNCRCCCTGVFQSVISCPNPFSQNFIKGKKCGANNPADVRSIIFRTSCGNVSSAAVPSRYPFHSHPLLSWQ